MKPSGPTPASVNSDIPLKISNYLILPLLLPPPPAAVKITYPTDKSKNGAAPTTSSLRDVFSNPKTTTAEAKTTPKASLDSPSKTYHYLYLQPHSPRLPHPDTSRSLYAVNLPIDATEAGIRALFADQLGGWRVERVRFEDEVEEDDGVGGDKAVDKGKKAGTKNGSVDEGLGIGVNRKRKRGKAGQNGKSQKEGPGGGVPMVPGRPNLPRTWDRTVHRSGSCAVIVFVDQQSAINALKAVRKVRSDKEWREIKWRPEGMPKLGIERYRKHAELIYPPHSIIQAAVDKQLSAFAAYEAARTAQLARQRNEPDEDGFVTVTRGAGGRAAPARSQYVQQTAERLKSRQEKMAGGSFYRFQVREKKKEKLKALKRGFQEDLKNVEGLRKKGRIRPI